MNSTLWANLMRALAPGKVLVVVGDMAMGPALNDDTWSRIRHLHCRHSHLVIGNHDITGNGTLAHPGVRPCLVGHGDRR